MSIRAISLGLAMVFLGDITVARGDCRPSGPTTTYYPDPCCRVGPVRRFLRRVFHPCCPPPCARYAPAVVVPGPAPCPPSAPAAWVPPGPPVRIDAPVAPQGTIPPPPVGVPSSLKNDIPPTPTPPVRFDRIASRRGDEVAGRLVILVKVGISDSRKQAETDETGRFSVELTPGTWVVYVKNVEQGRLVIREQKVVRVRIGETG